MKHNVRIADIAQELGLSLVTVSNALNGRPGVSEAERQRIKTRASQLGYRPPAPRIAHNTEASVTLQSGSVGIICSERFDSGNGSFYWYLIAGISRELMYNRLYSIFETVSAEEEERGILPEFIRERNVRGIVVVGDFSEAYLSRLVAMHIPLVLADSEDIEGRVDSVSSRNFEDASRVTGMLTAQGHRKIGFVGSVSASVSNLDRYMGFLKELMRRGITPRSEWRLEDRDSTGALFEEFDLPEELPTAFFCCCDETATRFVNFAQSRGLRVPQDISVAGFDNYVADEMSDPPVSTLEVDLVEMARRSVELLVARTLDMKKPVERVSLDGVLVTRDSVAPPRDW